MQRFLISRTVWESGVNEMTENGLGALWPNLAAVDIMILGVTGRNIFAPW